MTVPVHSTIPDSTLTPSAARRKISMSGLGCDVWDDFTNCEGDIDVSTGGGSWWDQFIPGSSSDAGLTNYTPSVINWDQYLHTQPDGTPYPFDPYTLGTQSAGAGNVYATGTRVDAGGDIVVMLSNGQQVSLQSNGQVMQGASSGTTRSGNWTMSSQQTTAWPSLINALVQAGVRLGTVAMLPSGTSLTPNGTIVGSGQSLVRPGVITSNSLTSGINAMLQNPMFLLAGFGVIALALFSGGRR